MRKHSYVLPHLIPLCQKSIYTFSWKYPFMIWKCYIRALWCYAARRIHLFIISKFLPKTTPNINYLYKTEHTNNFQIINHNKIQSIKDLFIAPPLHDVYFIQYSTQNIYEYNNAPPVYISSNQENITIIFWSSSFLISYLLCENPLTNYTYIHDDDMRFI